MFSWLGVKLTEISQLSSALCTRGWAGQQWGTTHSRVQRQGKGGSEGMKAEASQPGHTQGEDNSVKTAGHMAE